jgi:response regulator NasT
VLIRCAILDAGLREAGFGNVVLLGQTTGLLDQVYRLDRDVILIDLENPNRDVPEQMFQVSRIVRRPIAMFVHRSDRTTTEAAVEAGVSASIVGGLEKERVNDTERSGGARMLAFGGVSQEAEQQASANRNGAMHKFWPHCSFERHQSRNAGLPRNEEAAPSA